MSIGNYNNSLMSESLLELYDCLCDDESRALFVMRMLHIFPHWQTEERFYSLMSLSLEYDMQRLPPQGVRKLDYELMAIAEKYDTHKLTTQGFRQTGAVLTISEFLRYGLGDNIILWGAGDYGYRALRLLELHGIEVSMYVDADPQKWNTKFLDKPVISPSEFFHYHGDSYIGISIWFQQWDCYRKLMEKGFPESRIVTFLSWEKQYFGAEILQPLNDEIYVDVGVFSGETIANFVKFCNGSYKKIYAVEADKKNLPRISRYISDEGIRNIEIINKGAYSSHGLMSFLSDAIDSASHGSISQLSSNGNSQIEVAPLDDMLPDEKITLIKMDIEGAELEALKGCSRIITKYKPRLLISIYHKPEDVPDILEYIHGLVPEYKFCIRQYSFLGPETILYAIV